MSTNALVAVVVLIAFAGLVALVWSRARTRHAFGVGSRARHAFLARQGEAMRDRYGYDQVTTGVDGTSAFALTRKGDGVVVLSAVWPDRVDGEQRPPALAARTLMDDDLVATELRVDGYEERGVPRARAVDVVLEVRDPIRPAYVLRLLGEDTVRGSEAFESAMQQAMQWRGSLRALSSRAEMRRRASRRTSTLDQARQEGVVSEEDYRREKARLEAARLLEEARAPTGDDSLDERQTVRTMARVESPRRR